MLREAVRDEATERTWSEGVALARDQRVVGKRTSGDELELEVRVPSRATPYHVILNPKLDEWECDCPSKEAVCAHVVAGVIATEKAEGKLPTSTRPAARIRYLLEPDPGGIRVERVLVHADRTEPFTGQLMSIVARNKGEAIAIEEHDLLVDQLLGVRVGPISGEKVDRLLSVLNAADDVRWRGDPVQTSDDPVMPRAIVEDTADGVRVRIVPDPEVAEVVAVGVVRTHDDVLRPIGEVELSGPRLDKLPQQFDVPRVAIPELIGKTLPQLAQRIAIDVRATALPKVGGAKEEPRMQLDVAQDGDKLSIMATLVYGDPPRARVDGQYGFGGPAKTTLVHLSGPLPIRDEDAERRLVHRLRDELNLVPGRRVELTGREAFQVQQNLATWLRIDAKAAGGARIAPLDIRITIDGDKLDVDVVTSGGDSKAASVGAALRAWQAGLDVVPLSGGGWGRVPKDWFDKHGERLADLLATRGGDHRVPIYALPDLARLCEDLDRPPPPELDRLRPLLAGFDGIPHTTLPAGFVGELRPYQQSGLDWLSFCRDAGLGCVLADDMGLGKTIEALAALRDGKTLIVCPKSVLFNWLAEIAKFRPDLRVAPYAGTRRALDQSVDIVLTSYPILRNDIDVIAAVHWAARSHSSTSRRRSRTQIRRSHAPRIACTVAGGSRCRARPSRIGSTSCGASCTSRIPACSAVAPISRSDGASRS